MVQRKRKVGRNWLSVTSLFFLQSDFSLIPNCSYFRLIRGGKTLNDGKVKLNNYYYTVDTLIMDHLNMAFYNSSQIKSSGIIAGSTPEII